MPQGKSFWNPYRWVAISKKEVQHHTPSYHHRFSDLSGRLWCDLEALTPLLIGDGKGRFVRRGRRRQPYLPATSIKGAIRSLAEVVGNTAVPFRKTSVDKQHQIASARRGSRLDLTATTFGYLDGQSAFGGLIRFSDAELISSHSGQNRWALYKVAVGQPKPTHSAFYSDRHRRKFYHHHVGAERLTCPHPGIRQTIEVQPAPPGTLFRFIVDFENLREHELNLLLYCIVLEEQSTIELSPAALGRESHKAGKTLCGPLRHKLGGAKPHGAGSVHIHITKMELRGRPVARYVGNRSAEVWQGACLLDELTRRTEPFTHRTDQTMKELRAMLVYCTDDPRSPIQYPSYQWFNSNSNIRLKPTI